MRQDGEGWAGVREFGLSFAGVEEEGEVMFAWWHKLWCWECRHLYPVRLDTFPNDYPLLEPFSWGIFFYQLPEQINCPTARTICRASQDKAQAEFDVTVLPMLRGK